jgi:hypothetical protein
MWELKHKLHTILNMMKDFQSGYRGSWKDKILIKYEGKVILVTFEELGEGEIGDYMQKME